MEYDILENKTNNSIAYVKAGSFKLTEKAIRSVYVGKQTDQILINGSNIITDNFRSNDIYAYVYFHKENSPSVINTKFGCYWYYLNDELHRLDGPAIYHCENCDCDAREGDYLYYVEGKLHRLDGPARDWGNGDVEWWVNGIHLSPEKEKLLNIWRKNKLKIQ